MTIKKTVFISDIHLGPGWETDLFKDKLHLKNLMAMLDYILTHKDEIDELVLLGDIFDFWICPMDEKPPEFEEVLKVHPEVFAKLKTCVESLSHTFYLNGNHDMHVTQQNLDRICAGEKSIVRINRYNSGRLHAEHGNRFTMFNAEDKIHDPVSGYPLGYYISRMVAGQEKRVIRGIVFTIFDDIMEACLTAQSFTESFVEAVQEFLGLSPDHKIIMPDGRNPISIRQVSQRYADLFETWVKKFGYLYAVSTVFAELKWLGGFADRLCKKEGYKVVVFGHSHRSEVDKDSLFVKDDRIYANTGYWCTDHPTFVEVIKDKGRYNVLLKGFENGSLVDITQESV